MFSFFGFNYLVAVDDVGKEEGEEEDEDYGDKDKTNCWPSMPRQGCFMTVSSEQVLYSPQVVSSLTFESALVRPFFKYFQLRDEIVNQLN